MIIRATYPMIIPIIIPFIHQEKPEVPGSPAPEFAWRTASRPTSGTHRGCHPPQKSDGKGREGASEWPVVFGGMWT